MIRIESLPRPYRGRLTNGRIEAWTDAPLAKGGGGEGLGAHELLEAALAACINMAVRMHAARHDLPLEAVATEVRLSWPDPKTTKFEYSMALDGQLSAVQRAELEAVAESCPVRQTLGKQLAFEQVPTASCGA